MKQQTLFPSLCFLLQCCACFGPKGAAGDFCAPGCRGINGGTVTNKAQAWFWIRSSVPKIPAWRKCMEYEVQTEKGDTEIYFIDETTGVSKKVDFEMSVYIIKIFRNIIFLHILIS